MHLYADDVNEAFRNLVKVFAGRANDVPGTHGTTVVRRPSRNGNVLLIEEPVIVTYRNPTHRVLFNSARDANPFLHVYEALWMLAGRNDVGPVAHYAKQFLQYSDDGGTLNGAYGNRWRNAPRRSDEDEYEEGAVDQLDVLVEHLKADPNSRRAVLQMWTVEDDLLKIGPGKGTSKDVCCNLSVMFSLREGEVIEDEVKSHPHTGTFYTCRKYLDMTVTNRSNDLVWGMLGANYVHFTFLQEYMAARLGAEVGRYHHFTNNLHAYEWNWKPDEWLSDNTPNRYLSTGRDAYLVVDKKWKGDGVKPFPFVKDPATFDVEVRRFVERFCGRFPPHELAVEWEEPFLSDVAQPMLIAHACYKEGDFHGAFAGVGEVAADDWRIAADNWLRRRADRVRAGENQE